jgi:hypothetical protein
MPENETANSSAPPPDWPIARHADSPRTRAGASLWQRYRYASRPFQVGIGCGGLLTICVLLSCVAAAFGAGGTSTSSLTTPTVAHSARAPIAATSTPARPPSHVATATATLRPATPTRSSTATADPVARTAPTPTTHPIAAPPTPRPVPTATPRPRPAPTATPQPAALTLVFTCADAVDYSHGEVCVRTRPGAALTIRVVYCTGYPAVSRSLKGAQYADAGGAHVWTWKPETKCRGQATATVTARANGQTAMRSDVFIVR